MNTITINEAEKYIRKELVPELEYITTQLGTCLYDGFEITKYDFNYHGLEFTYVPRTEKSNKHYISVSLNGNRLFFYNYGTRVEYNNSNWPSLVDQIYDNVDNILESKRAKAIKK